MTEFYTLTSNMFQFVDSIDGTAAAGKVKNLVPHVIDRKFHKKVQTKTFFQKAGMIGPDTFREGTVTATAPGYPVLRKTDLVDNPGDVIRMGALNALTSTIASGVTGNTVLVEAEQGLDFDDVQVKITQYRQGVRNTGGQMDVQRNPYGSLESIEMEALSDWAAQVEDTAILYAANCGWGHHVLRENGHTVCPPTEVENLLIGNDRTIGATAETVANLEGGTNDALCAETFEISQTWCEQNNLDPVLINGEPYWVSLISPKAGFVLARDDRFHNAMLYARERGLTNPLFKNAEFVYANHIIFKYDKIRSVLAGYNPASTTVSSKVITETAYTGIGGGNASTDLHQMLVLGANAIALAEGKFRMAERIRKEDDYGNIIGRAIDSIFGTRRIKWTEPAGSTVTNQGMLKIITTLNLA